MIWLWKLIKTAAIAMSIAIAAMALPAFILPVAGQSQSAIVIFAVTVDPGSLPQAVTILGWDAHVARLDGVDSVTARRLYAEGAVLVMPFRKSGCISYRKA